MRSSTHFWSCGHAGTRAAVFLLQIACLYPVAGIEIAIEAGVKELKNRLENYKDDDDLEKIEVDTRLLAVSKQRPRRCSSLGMYLGPMSTMPTTPNHRSSYKVRQRY